eukprot:500964_1
MKTMVHVNLVALRLPPITVRALGGVCHWMSDTAWIEMSLSLSSLCDGASCAEWSLRLIVYVDAVNHDSDRYDPDIQMDAPFGLHIYDNGNWSRDWVCGDYWNNPF